MKAIEVETFNLETEVRITAQGWNEVARTGVDPADLLHEQALQYLASQAQDKDATLTGEPTAGPWCDEYVGPTLRQRSRIYRQDAYRLTVDGHPFQDDYATAQRLLDLP